MKRRIKSWIPVLIFVVLGLLWPAEAGDGTQLGIAFTTLLMLTGLAYTGVEGYQHVMEKGFAAPARGAALRGAAKGQAELESLLSGTAKLDLEGQTNQVATEELRQTLGNAISGVGTQGNAETAQMLQDRSDRLRQLAVARQPSAAEVISRVFGN